MSEKLLPGTTSGRIGFFGAVACGLLVLLDRTLAAADGARLVPFILNGFMILMFPVLALLWFRTKPSFLTPLVAWSALAASLLVGILGSLSQFEYLTLWVSKILLLLFAGFALNLFFDKLGAKKQTVLWLALGSIAVTLVAFLVGNFSRDLPEFVYLFFFANLLTVLYSTAGVGMFFLVLGISLDGSRRKLDSLNLSTEFRIKRYFSAKAKGIWQASLAASPFALFATGFAGFDYGLPAQSAFIFLLPILAFYISFAVIWIPSLIAYRAYEKGKSWGAFFWLSALVSPLIMWIIAEASSDTRNVYQQPVQPPQVQQIQSVYQASGTAQDVVSLPAQDIRACPECAEDIKRAAKLCKHCGSKVEPLA